MVLGQMQLPKARVQKCKLQENGQQHRAVTLIGDSFNMQSLDEIRVHFDRRGERAWYRI